MKRVPFLLLVLLLVVTLKAWGGTYDRAVRFDWEPIPEAKKYEVQWFTGQGCTTEAGTSVVPKPSWGARLPAGRYCFRARGVGLGDRAGQWTELQHFDIAPKPPAAVNSSGHANEWNWSEVDYAKKYEVELKDPSGRTIYRESTAKNSIRIPEQVIQEAKTKYGQFDVLVRTEVEGLPPSAPRRGSFTVEAPAAPGGAAKVTAQNSSDSKVKRSPAEELIQKATVPVDPVTAIPDWRLTFGTGLAFYNHNESNPMNGDNTGTNGQASTTGSGSAIKFSAMAESVPKGWLGAYLFYDTQSVSGTTSNNTRSLDGGRVNLTAFGAGLTANFAHDKAWGPRWTFGMGPRFSSSGLIFISDSSGSTSSQTWTLAAQTLGLDLRFHTVWGLNDHWAIFGDLLFSGGPEQHQYNTIVEAKSIYYHLKLGPIYKWQSNFWLQGTAYYDQSKFYFTNEGKESTTYVSDYGVMLQAVLRTGPSDGRSIASVSSVQESHAKLWSLKAELPISFRSQDYLLTPASNGTGTEPAFNSDSASPVGVEATIERHISAESAFWLGGKIKYAFYALANQSLKESVFSLYGAYELPIGARPDLQSRVFLGLSSRSEGAAVEAGSGVSSRYSTSVNPLEFFVGGELKRFWGAKFAGTLEGKLGLPFYLSGAEGAGTSYVWAFGGAVDYRLSNKMDLTGGYTYQQARYTLTSTIPSSTGTISGVTGLSFTEHQFRLGIKFAW